MRTTGPCPRCGETRLLPGRDVSSGAPVCGPCAKIGDLTCTVFGQEAEHYRSDCCARCALTQDLTELIIAERADPDSMRRIMDVLRAADRPESVPTWLRSPKVRSLLSRLGQPELPLTTTRSTRNKPGDMSSTCAASRSTTDSSSHETITYRSSNGGTPTSSQLSTMLR